MSLRMLPGVQPDEIDLELLRGGAAATPGQAARIEDAAAGPLSELDDELRQFRAEWRRVAPPLRPKSWARRVRPSVAAAALLLAAAVLVVALWGGAADPYGVRAMGPLPVDVAAVQPGVTLDALHAGDQLTVALSAPADGWVDLYSVQENGAVTVLVAGMRVSAGEAAEIGGTIVLDEYAGREWLVVAHSQTERDESMVRQHALAHGSSPAAGPSHFVLDVTRQP